MWEGWDRWVGEGTASALLNAAMTGQPAKGRGRGHQEIRDPMAEIQRRSEGRDPKDGKVRIGHNWPKWLGGWWLAGQFGNPDTTGWN